MSDFRQSTVSRVRSTAHQNVGANYGLSGTAIYGREVFFIDAALHDWCKIVANLRADVEVVVLDPKADYLAQIVDTFACCQPPQAVHIASRGSGGHLQLGKRHICLVQLPGYVTPLAALQGNLLYVDDAVLYGCELTDVGDASSFLQALLEAGKITVPVA